MLQSSSRCFVDLWISDVNRDDNLFCIVRCTCVVHVEGLSNHVVLPGILEHFLYTRFCRLHDLLFPHACACTNDDRIKQFVVVVDCHNEMFIKACQRYWRDTIIMVAVCGNLSRRSIQGTVATNALKCVCVFLLCCFFLKNAKEQRKAADDAI